jgi:L-alanine-DL-glutamate epimerase-like enolase superfamily enzyme
MSAMDIALWGTAGKAPNAPVYRIVAGEVTDMECIANLVRYADPPQVRAGVRHATEAGFRTLKLHEMKPSAMRPVREEAGPDIEPTVDVSGEKLNAVDLTWLEEPLRPREKFDGLAKLRRTSGIPDIVQPSPASPALHNIPAMPHDFYDGPGLLAAIHGACRTGHRLHDRVAPVRSGSTHP